VVLLGAAVLVKPWLVLAWRCRAPGVCRHGHHGLDPCLLALVCALLLLSFICSSSCFCFELWLLLLMERPCRAAATALLAVAAVHVLLLLCMC
jgi:hypothetical protein